MDKLAEIFVGTLAVEGCSTEDLQFACSHAHSGNTMDYIHANGILLSRGEEVQKREALHRLLELLRNSKKLTVQEQFHLLVIFVQLRHQIPFEAVIKDFIFEAARSPYPELRCNASIILEHLMREDQKALDTLRMLSTDSDESVRTNARTFLRSLGSDGARACDGV